MAGEDTNIEAPQASIKDVQTLVQQGFGNELVKMIQASIKKYLIDNTKDLGARLSMKPGQKSSLTDPTSDFWLKYCTYIHTIMYIFLQLERCFL